MTIRKDVVSGIIFVVLGLTVIAYAQAFNMGTARLIGPAAFPTLLGGLLTLLGGLLTVRALLSPSDEEPLRFPELGAALLLLVAVIGFSVLVRPFGLVAALMFLILISSFAIRRMTVGERAFVVVFYTALPIAIFVFGLRIYANLWPS